MGCPFRYSDRFSTSALEINFLVLSFDIHLAMNIWKDFITLISLETWPIWIASLLGKLSHVLAEYFTVNLQNILTRAQAVCTGPFSSPQRAWG